jgi:catechol 2,3-dioxygenase-like lactoylglutathione lyase family enzyme
MMVPGSKGKAGRTVLVARQYLTMKERGRATRVWVAAVRVTDLDRSLAFYRDVLGFTLRLENRQFGWIELGPEDPMCKIGLSLARGSGGTSESPKRSGIVPEVDDMEAFVQRLRDAGTRITREPVRGPWGGLVADFLDPDDNEIEAVFDPDHYRREDRR